MTGLQTGHFVIMTAVHAKRREISATELKAKCLRILDELGAEGIVITKHGKPVAELRPIPTKLNSDLIGSMKGKIRVHGDIFSTGVQWDAES